MGKKRAISETPDVKKNKKFAYEQICEEEERLSKLLFGDVDEVINTGTVEKPAENVPESTAAWEDEDDTEITVNAALQSQNRKLPNGGVNDKQNTYASLLKHKYTNLVGTPNWAKVDKKVDYDSDDEILRSCGHIASNSTETSLQKGTLEIKQLTDLNAETYTEGPFIHSLEFHPTSTVGLVAGPSAIFSLFAVDGKRNNKIHSVKLDQFPIKCAKFNGDEIVFGSSRQAPYMYIYDLEKAQGQRIYLPQDMTNMQRFEISPCGQYIAVSGRFGELFLLHAKSKERICSFKQDAKVRAMSFTPDSKHIYAHSETGTVTVWDIKMQRVVNRWYDDGCIQGSSIDISPCGQYVATGSFEGAVNLYDRQSLDVENPKPLKAILNLTTCIQGLKFNATSEILAFSSQQKDGDVKLLHVNSQTVFSNFPGFNTKIHKVNSLAFSPQSGYFAVGNNKSKVLLYRLKHYGSY